MLDVDWVQSTGTIHGGTVVKGTVVVHSTKAKATGTRLAARAGSNAVVGPSCARTTAGCTLPAIAEDARFRYPSLTVTIPKSMASGKVAFTLTAWADNAKAAPYNGSITVTKKPTSSDSSSNNSSSSSNNSSGDSSSSDSNGSGSSGGSSGSGSGNSGTTTTGLDSSLPFAAPNSGGALQPAQPQTAQFPQIAPPTANGTAPPGSQTTQTMGSLRAAPAGPTELTFQRLASTQAAWLAALLVAFSLLLTQVRLGKPLDARRRKGAHRRARRGAFQA